MRRSARSLKFTLWILTILAPAIAATAWAENTGADRIDSFVPKGWTVEDTVQGDITGNGTADKVLMLLSKASQEGPDGAEHPRQLVILERTSSGSYKLVASSKDLLLCEECFGALGGKPDISVTKKHVLIVDQMAGSRFTDEGIWRFRIEHGTGKLRLIGLDVWHRDTASGSSDFVSTNYLTGRQAESHYQYDEKKQKGVLVSKKTRRVPMTSTYLEQVTSKSMEDE